MAKMLYVDPAKCTGCRTCELVCSVRNEGIVNPILSRIQVVAEKYEGKRTPIVCQQCEDAPCMAVCPTHALTRDSQLDMVKLNPDRCIGCKMCVVACPFGAIALNTSSGKVFKCELCGGEPTCVKFCEDKAIVYLAPDVLVMEKKRETADKVAVVAGERAAEPAAVGAAAAGPVAKGIQVEDADAARERPVVRCKACEIRFEVPLDVELAECPRCGARWRISWPAPGHAYVRGQA